MSDIEFNLTGMDQLVGRLQKLSAEMYVAVERAAYVEMSVERQESMRRTPVKTGALRSSHTLKVTRNWREVTATIGVGGVAAPYAVHVHENLEALHPNGQAKFLESTIRESLPFLAARIARHLDVKGLA